MRIAGDDDSTCRRGESRKFAVFRVFDAFEKSGGGIARIFFLGVEQDAEFFPIEGRDAPQYRFVFPPRGLVPHHAAGAAANRINDLSGAAPALEPCGDKDIRVQDHLSEHYVLWIVAAQRVQGSITGLLLV